MSKDHLAALGIDIDRAAAAVDFLRSYARHCDAELEESRAEVQVSRYDDDRGQAIRADAASAYRDAGQWAIGLGDRRAPGLPFSAADHYLRLGLPYGQYLWMIAEALASGGPMKPNNFLSVNDLITQLESAIGLAREPAPLLLAFRYPQQQAYAFLVACSLPAPDVDQQYALTRIGVSRAEDTTPLGSLGVPASAYWTIGIRLLHTTSVDGILDVLDSMATRFADAAERARVNHYLWQNCAAPVDLVDIDILGITILAARKFGVEKVSETYQHRRTELPTMARLQLALATSVAFLRPEPWIIQ